MKRLLPLFCALVDQALVSGAGFAFAVLVYRRGGLDDFGYFSLAMAVLILATNAHGALVTNPMTVFLPEHSEPEARSYLSGLRRLHRWLPLVLTCASLAFLFTDYRELAPLTAIAAAASMGAEYHRKLCYASHQSGRALLIDAIGYAPLLAAWFLPWAHGEHARVQAMAIVAGSACLRWAIGSLMTRNRHESDAAPLRPIAERHFAYGRWGLGQILASWGGGQVYPFLVAGIVGIEGSGAMSACLKIVGVTHVILWGLETFLQPRLRRYYLENTLARFLRRLALYSAGILTAVGSLLLPCILFPNVLLRVIYGDDAAHRGQELLPIIAFMYVPLTLEIILTLGLTSMKSPRAGFIGHALCALLTICAGPWIVLHYGVMGATLALLGNAVLRCLVMGWAFGSLTLAEHRRHARTGIEALQ